MKRFFNILFHVFLHVLLSHSTLGDGCSRRFHFLGFSSLRVFHHRRKFNFAEKVEPRPRGQAEVKQVHAQQQIRRCCIRRQQVRRFQRVLDRLLHNRCWLFVQEDATSLFHHHHRLR